MTSFAGAMLLTAGTGLWGVRQAYRLRKRAENLKSMRLAAARMRMELGEHQVSMKRVLHLLGDSTQGGVSLFFRRAEEKMAELGTSTFAELWHMALQETPELELGKEGMALTENAGTWLGKYDTRVQCQALERLERELERLERETCEQYRREGRLRMALGFAAGACMSILLV